MLLFQYFKSVGSKWESSEINFLEAFLQRHPPPNPISNEHWRNLASSMNETFGTSRTGLLKDSCTEHLALTLNII